jgi:excisionase family DNA binding protein
MTNSVIRETLTIEKLPTFFSPRQLAEILGVSKDTAYRLASSEQFPSVRIGKRILIYKDSFTDWITINFAQSENN